MKKIPFKIVSIKTEKFDVKCNVSLPNHVDVKTSFGFAVNCQEKLVKCSAIYSYISEGNKVIEISLSCVFAIEPTAFSEMLQDNKFVIEPFFAQYLATINVGAARGEIHARCELAQSPLAEIILPPINLVEALSKAIVIDL